MCFEEGGLRKHQLKCMVIAIISLITHACLLCFIITILIVELDEKNASIHFHKYLRYGTGIQMYLREMNKNTIVIVSGLSIALSVFGVVASVLLLIGSKYNKPGCVVVYFCYILQTNIILLISGILLLLKLQWSLAAIVLSLFGVTCGITMAVNKFHEAMHQDALHSQRDHISDITHLIEAESLDDMTAEDFK